MIIRPEQVEAFRVKQQRDYIERALDWVRIHYPEEYYTRPTEELTGFLEDSLSRALSFGLSMEDVIGRYIEYRLLFGPELENAPERHWVLSTLKDTGRPEDERVAAIDFTLLGYSNLPHADED